MVEGESKAINEKQREALPESRGQPTFQILGRKNDGSKMMVFDKAFNLRGHFGAIPAHNQHLPKRPGNRS